VKLKSSKTSVKKVLQHLKIYISKFLRIHPVQIFAKGILIIFIIAFFASAWIYRKDMYRYVVQRVLYNLGIIEQAKKTYIDINYKNYMKLAYKREVALEKGVNFSSSEDYVPATFTVDDKMYRIKMRLKGDNPDHWILEKKWSYRIRVRDEKTIFGMKQFSIQHPNTRSHLVEWLFHKLQGYLGLINLRYDFIEVVLNGENLGLYAIEEHFDKLLIENNKYKEGPIVRFNDNIYWQNLAEKRGDYIDYPEAYWLGPIDVFHPKRTQRNADRMEQFHNARNLLESLRQGRLKAHQVFNIDKLAMLFALVDLWGNHHAYAYHNVRFYYNPVTSRLIPIGFDSSDLSPAHSLVGSTQEYEEKKNRSSWELCIRKANKPLRDPKTTLFK